MSGYSKKISMVAVVLASMFLTGCAGNRFANTNKTSLVDFLYPDKQGYVATTEIAQLNLPLRVGVAFTPSRQYATTGFSELEKNALAQQVVKQFAALDFVKSIEVIPSDYLRPGGSFANLNQLQQLFGVDVVVLLSYDQRTLSTEGLASLTYWTIVGAYVIPGEKNDTQTLIDAAVYDIASKKLLFRAPGSSVVKSHGTLVGNARILGANSIQGFNEAGQQLTKNLAGELDNFKAKVKASPEQYRVTLQKGYSGSGANGGIFMVMVCGMLLTALVQGSMKRSNNRKDS